MNQELTKIVDEISPEELKLPRAIEFARAAEFLPFVELLRSKRFEPFGEIVDVRVEVELAQIRQNDIRKFEDFSILFFEDMDTMPMAFALRPDFPTVPHLNLHLFPDDIKSLCLFDVPFSELKTRWSGAFLIKRLREWLALTAEGNLHQEDQPLEFLLPDPNWNLVLPHDLFKTKDEFLYIYNYIDLGDAGPKTIFAQREPPNGQSVSNKLAFIALQITCEPQVHGLIHRIPSNISALNNFLLPGGVNLIENLRSQLLSWDDPELPQNIAEARLILLVVLPKTRYEGGEVEGDPELRAFITTEDDIGMIGTKLGLWSRVGKKYGRLIGNKPDGSGENICIEMVNPMFTFSKSLARTANKVAVEQNPKVTLIGVGALGSQVFLNLARSGYGTWKLLDKDILLPHNLARHALSEAFLGFPKAKSLAAVANNILNDEDFSKGIFEDVLRPKEDTVVKEALSDADIIFDISTSVAVGRHLANAPNLSARRTSLFLSPSGKDLVMLAEDVNREIPLDALEMQYYRALLRQPALENHLFDPDTPSVRYGYTCRDLSSEISQDDVLSHAAIGSRAFKQLEDDKGALISIWRLSENGEIQKISVDPEPILTHTIDGWTMIMDMALVRDIQVARRIKLPNETGGLLLGTYDMGRKIIYLVDTIHSPKDSEEWPTIYRRSFRGVGKKLDRVQKITMDNLEYVGEWHSHPDGAGCLPSAMDLEALQRLSEDVMAPEGLPALMLIVAENNECGFYLGKMEGAR